MDQSMKQLNCLVRLQLQAGTLQGHLKKKKKKNWILYDPYKDLIC